MTNLIKHPGFAFLDEKTLFFLRHEANRYGRICRQDSGTVFEAF